MANGTAVVLASVWTEAWCRRIVLREPRPWVIYNTIAGGFSVCDAEFFFQSGVWLTLSLHSILSRPVDS